MNECIHESRRSQKNEMKILVAVLVLMQISATIILRDGELLV